MICSTWSFSRVAVLNLVFLSTWDGVLRESLELPKGSLATCRVWWGMQDGSGANSGESGLISMWFGVHGALSCSCGDLRVYLYLWDYSWGLSGIPSRKSRLLSCLMGNTDLLCTQCRGIAPHLAARGKSHGFSRVVVGTWGMFLSYGGDGSLKLVLVQQRQDSCLVARDTSRFSSRLGRAIGTPLEVRREAQCPFPVSTGILGFLSIFKRRQASTPFEALNCTCLSSCQRDVRPPVVMRQGTKAFSRVSTGDSDIPSSCEMKDEPAFKSLQGNPGLFRVRASRCPFHLSSKLRVPLT